MMDAQQQDLIAPGQVDQFRLVRLQTYNWGTFDKLTTIPISEDGFLFGGPTGSGKSTLLDAHPALMTPPRSLVFNSAARDSKGSSKERTVISYVRGAWGQSSSNDLANETVINYLRTGTVWSAISELYRTAQGAHVTLFHIMWVRGATNNNTDVKHLYGIAGSDVDLLAMDFFRECDFDIRQFKTRMPDVFVTPDSPVYQERMRRLFGIPNERALRLLQKTQSAQSLGDLNTFLRAYMLDEPETFEVADRLVEEFGKLQQAHKAVADARIKRDILEPARAAYEERSKLEDRHLSLRIATEGIDAYAKHLRRDLLKQRLHELHSESNGLSPKVQGSEQRVRGLQDELLNLRVRRRESGGGDLERLNERKAEAVRQRPLVDKRQREHQADLAVLGLSLPDEPNYFGNLQQRARAIIESQPDAMREASDEVVSLTLKKKEREATFIDVSSQVRAMEARNSLIGHNLLDIRKQMIEKLGLPTDSLPFAGELMEVRKEDAQWRPVIEFVLGRFANSLLVEDSQYDKVATYLNDRSLRGGISYNRMLPRGGTETRHASESIPSKLILKDGPYRHWLSAELAARFDHLCAESIKDFRTAPRAVTREGQVKSSQTRHERVDSKRMNDRHNWSLGFDNREKLAGFIDEAQRLGEEISRLQQEISEVETRQRDATKRVVAANAIVNRQWAEIDLAGLTKTIADLDRQIKDCLESNPDLAALDTKITKKGDELEQAESEAERHRTRMAAITAHIAADQAAVAALFGGPALPASLYRELQERFNAVRREPLLEPHEGHLSEESRTHTPDGIAKVVERSINSEVGRLSIQIAEHKASIESIFAQFNRDFPADSDGLDPVLDSASDYFAKLEKLLQDGLPDYERRFLELLNKQTDENLVILQSKHSKAARNIEDRLEMVNEALRSVPFSVDTHLEIRTKRRSIAEVIEFHRHLKEVLSNTHSSEEATAENAEARYTVLASLVKRLGSRERADEQWKALVLDVRLHIDFLARELDKEGQERMVYRGNDGQSGGQRQKLTATILASALRYQLAGDEGVPRYATVALDEAFVLADPHHTGLALNIFRSFGFQLLIGAPLDKVRSIEKFIGGATFVTIRDGRYSTAVPIAFDAERRQLQMPGDAGQQLLVANA